MSNYLFVELFKTHLIIIFSTLRFDELSRLEPLYATTFTSNLQAFGTRCKIDEVIPGQSWSRVQISGHGNVTYVNIEVFSYLSK